MAERTLNLRGLKCPLPALRARKALTGLKAGDMLIAECTDPLTAIDIPNLLSQTGERLDSRARADDVHDRENAGPAIEGDLLLLVIWKQPAHALIAGRQRPDQVGRQQRVDFALDQHVLERFIVRHLRDLEARRRREIDVLVELTEP